MKGTVIESMKKTMFRRMWAFALAGLLSLSLASPAMAATNETTVKRSALTIEKAIDGATYKIIPLLGLETSGEKTGTDGSITGIDGYTYTVPSGTVGDAVKAVIGTDSEFAATFGENNAVTHTGFQLANSGLVVFRVVTGEGQTVDDAYAAWSKSVDGQAFMLKFADKVKEQLEADGFDWTGIDVTKVKDNGEADAAKGYVADENDAAGTVKVTLDYGYYMVISGAGQRAIICTNPVVGDAEINEKNEAPSVTKKVYESADGTYKDKNDGNIGDLVYFQSVITAGTGLNHLTFKDTLSKGLDFVALVGIDFYPRTVVGTGVDAKGEVPYAPDETTGNVPNDAVAANREFYLDAKSGDTNGGKSGSLLPAVSDSRYDWTSGNTKGISLKNDLSTIFIDASVVSETEKKDDVDVPTGRHIMTIDFDEIWLTSKRASSTDAGKESDNRDEYVHDPIYLGDPRVDENASATDCAKYNQYLGDMSTTLDDGGLIVIRYVARLNDEAVIGETGNDNTVKVEYGNNPEQEPLETPDTPDTETRTYVYELDVLKHMTGDENTKLAGAKFQLRRAGVDLTDVDLDAGTITVADADIDRLASKNPIMFVDLGNGSYRVKTDEDTAESGKTITDELVSSDSGSIMVKGLDADLYSLTETEAPNGYILATEPVYAVLGSVYAGTAEVKDDQSVVMSVYTQNKDDKNRFDAMKNDAGMHINQVKIENASGLRMPETGGIGTTIFYVVGASMVVAAGVFLVVKKRMGRGEE